MLGAARCPARPVGGGSGPSVSLGSGMQTYTIGHSTLSQEAMLSLLEGAGVRVLADVRRFARSRTNPQFNADAFAPALQRAGLAYLPMPALGGRRPARRAGESPNGLWREAGFRGFADYALTAEFRAAFAQLQERAAREPLAVMCSEALWWRCHRRIIADYLIVSGLTVLHILGSRIEPAKLTPGAAPQPKGSILYPAVGRAP